MGLFDALGISSTGLTAQRLRMDVTAENLANAQTTRTANGGPYRRKEVVLQEVAKGGGFAGNLRAAMGAGSSERPGGVEVSGIAEDSTPNKMVYDPGHPDADANGYVAMPAVDGISEMVDLMGAARAYEAGTTVLSTVRAMAEQALRIGK
jgi:flagellar basal-body rod protein FlgC